MACSKNPSEGHDVRVDRGHRSGAELLDVRAVAALLGCSTRHVYRMSDAGRMPAPLRLGALVRWNRAALSEWIERGCPNLRRAGGAR